MATRALLAELAPACPGPALRFESVGGVDAARRVAGGEPFDLVVLAADAIAALAAGGHVAAGSARPLAESPMAIAARAGSAPPVVASADLLREAVLRAKRVGCSTGPSGVALKALFERWGLAAALEARLVQAPPGVPVGALIADGRVELGFQQLSELQGLDGVAVLGTMPPGLEIVTTFGVAVGARSRDPRAAQAALAWLCGGAAAGAIRRHGMAPPSAAGPGRGPAAPGPPVSPV